MYVMKSCLLIIRLLIGGLGSLVTKASSVAMVTLLIGQISQDVKMHQLVS